MADWRLVLGDRRLEGVQRRLRFCDCPVLGPLSSGEEIDVTLTSQPPIATQHSTSTATAKMVFGFGGGSSQQQSSPAASMGGGGLSPQLEAATTEVSRRSAASWTTPLSAQPDAYDDLHLLLASLRSFARSADSST